MSTITASQEITKPVERYYGDHCAGRPVALVHGCPLSGASWEKQVGVLLAAGDRAMKYDRRGLGQSSTPATGCDYDTFAADLDRLMTRRDLREATLVGFSMGGGEVPRFLGRYGSERVTKGVFVAAISPFLLKAEDDPSGVDGSVFEGIKQLIAADRPGFLDAFLRDFSWLTDFRKDLSIIDVPTLIVHGHADRVLPVATTGIPLSKSIKGTRLVVVEGGPDGITWTHAQEVNTELVNLPR